MKNGRLCDATKTKEDGLIAGLQEIKRLGEFAPLPNL
jgi:hypothetical protein